MTISLTKFDFLSLVVVGRSLILFENQNYPLSTCLDELKFYRRLRFLGYLWFSLSISMRGDESCLLFLYVQRENNRFLKLSNLLQPTVSCLISTLSLPLWNLLTTVLWSQWISSLLDFNRSVFLCRLFGGCAVTLYFFTEV